MVHCRGKGHTALSDQREQYRYSTSPIPGDPSTYTLHGAYYLKEGVYQDQAKGMVRHGVVEAERLHGAVLQEGRVGGETTKPGKQACIYKAL